MSNDALEVEVTALMAASDAVGLTVTAFDSLLNSPTSVVPVGEVELVLPPCSVFPDPSVFSDLVSLEVEFASPSSFAT